MEQEEKEEKDEKHLRQLFCKTSKVKKHLFTLKIKPLDKTKHSVGREFQSLTVWGKKLLTEISLEHLRIVTEISCNP